ncbi:hypothetical protein J6590_020600 [Homalodisca vitripennis]|nr:hypothetical protein J6590_020600 [Homalodisca vitripennis]
MKLIADHSIGTRAITTRQEWITVVEVNRRPFLRNASYNDPAGVDHSLQYPSIHSRQRAKGRRDGVPGEGSISQLLLAGAISYSATYVHSNYPSL